MTRGCSEARRQPRSASLAKVIVLRIGCIATAVLGFCGRPMHSDPERRIYDIKNLAYLAGTAQWPEKSWVSEYLSLIPSEEHPEFVKCLAEGMRIAPRADQGVASPENLEVLATIVYGQLPVRPVNDATHSDARSGAVVLLDDPQLAALQSHVGSDALPIVGHAVMELTREELAERAVVGDDGMPWSSATMGPVPTRGITIDVVPGPRRENVWRFGLRCVIRAMPRQQSDEADGLLLLDAVVSAPLPMALLCFPSVVAGVKEKRQHFLILRVSEAVGAK